jgi:hypothetical protein
VAYNDCDSNYQYLPWLIQWLYLHCETNKINHFCYCKAQRAKELMATIALYVLQWLTITNISCTYLGSFYLAQTKEPRHDWFCWLKPTKSWYFSSRSYYIFHNTFGIINPIYLNKILIKPIILCRNTFAGPKINQYSTGLFVSYSSEKPNCTKNEPFYSKTFFVPSK